MEKMTKSPNEKRPFEELPNHENIPLELHLKGGLCHGKNIQKSKHSSFESKNIKN